MPALNKKMKDEFIEAVIKTLPEFKSFDAEPHIAAIRAEIERGMPDAIKEFDRAFPGLILRQGTASKKGVPEYLLSDEVLADLKIPSMVRLRIYVYYCNRAPGADTETDAVKSLWEVALEARNEWVSQAKERHSLIIRLGEVVKACKTDSALAEALPEFKHLIPEPPEKATPLALTTTSQLVADMIKCGAKIISGKQKEVA